jgi:predicted signal transduction protein with EAL and GGDEF domain
LPLPRRARRLCEGIADGAHAARIAERVVSAFDEPFSLGGEERFVIASVGMARALGMRTVPEGVETQGRLERLIALECDFVQGDHLGRPQPARALGPRLRGG